MQRSTESLHTDAKPPKNHPIATHHLCYCTTQTTFTTFLQTYGSHHAYAPERGELKKQKGGLGGGAGAVPRLMVAGLKGAGQRGRGRLLDGDRFALYPR
jgi:hypothetical protein